MKKAFLEAGKIVGTHGVRGELRVQPWCDAEEIFIRLKRIYMNKGADCLKVLGCRLHKNLVLLRLEGIDTVEKGDLLREKVLYLNREDVTLPDGRYFIQDLMGISVINADTKQCYGKITDIFSTAANDVYEVTDDKGKSYLFPAIPDILIDINPENEVMQIRPLPGIFDESEEIPNEEPAHEN